MGPAPSWRHPVILAILIACLLPELLLSGADWGLWGNPRWRALALSDAGFWSGLLHNWRPNYPLQPWTMFFSYSFLHSGAVHFAVNMMTLVSLGPALVGYYGPWRFLAIYAGSAVGGAVGFALLSGQTLPMVGASGALFGLAGALVALAWRDIRARRDSLWPVTRAVLGLAGLNLVLWWAMKGQLAWETHLGGFLAGWVLALLLDPEAASPDASGKEKP